MAPRSGPGVAVESGRKQVAAEWHLCRVVRQISLLAGRSERERSREESRDFLLFPFAVHRRPARRPAPRTRRQLQVGATSNKMDRIPRAATAAAKINRRRWGRRAGKQLDSFKRKGRTNELGRRRRRAELAVSLIQYRSGPATAPTNSTVGGPRSERRRNSFYSLHNSIIRDACSLAPNGL